MALDNVQINSLALRYAQDRDEGAFNQLFQILEPVIVRMARKCEFRTKIPKEEFISAFNLGIWEAVSDFNGSSNFMQRLHFFLRRKEADIFRYHKKYIKRGFLTEDIDKEIDDDGNTYQDVLPSPESVEAEVLETMLDDDIKKLLAGFSRTNEQHSKVIHLLAQNCTNEELAIALGANEYDARVRKLVQRARQNFRKYLDSRKVLL